jgi:hypothetical protein
MIQHCDTSGIFGRNQPSRATLPLALLLFLLAAGAVRAADTAFATGPAKDWALPLFTPDGYRSMTLRGSEVVTVGPDRIDIVDMNIAVFSGDAAARVDTVLLSPYATFQPKEARAEGGGSVRLVRDDIDVTGERWTYDYNRKKVSIQRNLRVAFRAQLNGILK